jgi:hypothetical protein
MVEQVLTRNVLVSAKGSSHEGAVGERDAVLRRRREKALEQSDGRVKDDMALSTSLGTDVDLAVVGKV